MEALVRIGYTFRLRQHNFTQGGREDSISREEINDQVRDCLFGRRF